MATQSQEKERDHLNTNMVQHLQRWCYLHGEFCIHTWYKYYMVQSIVHIHTNMRSKIKLPYVSLCIKYEMRKTILSTKKFSPGNDAQGIMLLF